MKWTQQTIHAWGIATFGEAARNSLGLAVRMAKEAVELSWVMRCGADEDVVKESADVAIVLVQVANCIGFDIKEVIEAEGENEFKILVASEMEAIEDSDHCSEMINQYAVDLISANFHGEFDEAKRVIIRIVAMLQVICEMYEFNLSDKMCEKMDINEARKWAKAQDGSFQHV